MSRMLGTMHLALAVLWFGPWHGAPSPTRVSNVQQFNELVPWAPLFLVVGALILGCSYAKRRMVLPHAAGFVLMGVFGVLVTMGALPLWGQSVGSFVAPVLALTLSGVHFLMQRSYVVSVVRP
jgi:hypothetical protein